MQYAVKHGSPSAAPNDRFPLLCYRCPPPARLKTPGQRCRSFRRRRRYDDEPSSVQRHMLSPEEPRQQSSPSSSLRVQSTTSGRGVKLRTDAGPSACARQGRSSRRGFVETFCSTRSIARCVVESSPRPDRAPAASKRAFDDRGLPLTTAAALRTPCHGDARRPSTCPGERTSAAGD